VPLGGAWMRTGLQYLVVQHVGVHRPAALWRTVCTAMCSGAANVLTESHPGTSMDGRLA
jgi:hypothetical protein